LFDEDGHLLFTQGETLAAGYPLEGLYRNADGEAAVATPVEEFGATGPFEDVTAGDMFPPHGIQPQMWEIIQIRLIDRDGRPHFFTRLVGYIRDTSILMTIPRLHRRPLGMVEGEAVEVRMLTGRNIYVFRSQIIKGSMVPAPYMHLSFPDKVQRQSLRKAPWAKVNLPAVADSNGTHSDGKIVNLSASGARVDAAASLGEPGKTVKLSFQIDLDGMSRAMSLSAKIVHGRAHPPIPKDASPLVEHGVEFQGVSEEDALWLRCLVYQRIAEGFLV
jgi:hypothetical protein